MDRYTVLPPVAFGDALPSEIEGAGPILDLTEKGDAEVHRDHRASDAERHAVVRRLERALRDGRLTVAEFDERSRAAYAAETISELKQLTEDLPPDLW